MDAITIPTALAELGARYEAAGHEIWLVGGCVRDHVLGLPCKDVDLATSATPEEQVAICEAGGYRWYGTGLQHGTLTVLAGGVPYEITTFRTDVETDGRHATVAYTRDLETDLARRDLTINAIAMSFDGRVVDPFGGVHDALARHVRFVGRPAERIAEDYLRILRWFRFMGRFADALDQTGPDVEAIAAGAKGLSRISVERVWLEMQRILSGPRPYGVIDLMKRAGVLAAIGIEGGDTDRLADMRPHTDDPRLLLAAWMGDAAPDVAQRWKTSADEREEIAFASSRMTSPYALADVKADLVRGVPKAWIMPILKLRGMRDEYRAVADWDAPAFPIQGRDLLASGMKAGTIVGDTLRRLREDWTASDYTLTRDDLLSRIPPSQ